MRIVTYLQKQKDYGVFEIRIATGSALMDYCDAVAGFTPVQKYRCNIVSDASINMSNARVDEFST